MSELRTVAALYVERNGAYWNLPDVDPWDETRDARTYAGPHPVVAHPPCGRWCQMAPVNQARYGQPIGEDGGCFSAALDAVRTWGGVLEHPAVSIAWRTFGLPTPPASGGWIKTMCGGWTCHVEQRNYGHAARKATWLYAYGVNPPGLIWGRGPAPTAWISTDRPRAELAARGIRQMQKPEARKTPEPFRDLLLSIARHSNPPAVRAAHVRRASCASSLGAGSPPGAPQPPSHAEPSADLHHSTALHAEGVPHG